MTSSAPLAVPPRWSSPRRPDRPTWGPRVAAIAAAIRKPLMPWQAYVADLALEVNPDTGHLAYREVRLTVPRQSGKSTLVLAKNTWRMADAAALGGRQHLTYTAQTRDKARQKFVEDYLEELRAAHRLRGRWTSRLSNGSESIRWKANGSLWGIEAPTQDAGHGSTLDDGTIDEAFARVDWRVEQGFRPAMITRPDAQLWVISTAGTDSSLDLHDKVDTGRQLAEAGVDTGVCYIEWSAAEDADPADPATWWSCMPALGHTQTEASIAAEYAGMPPGEFARAYLNWRQRGGLVIRQIPADAWQACSDPASQIAAGGVLVPALDVGHGGSWAAISIAGRRVDGLTHAEVIDRAPADDWCVPRLRELYDRWGEYLQPVVLDPAGPAGALMTDLDAAGIPVRSVTSREMAQACGYLKRVVVSGELRHLERPDRGGPVTDGLAGAATRKLLDTWAWVRETSAVDISPLVSLTLAAWGLSEAPAAYNLAESVGG